MKLRIYLASPQKFDETIEFGFPSLAGRDTIVPDHRHQSSHQQSTVEGSTFFDDDNASVKDDGEDEDKASIADTDGPNTPQDLAFHSAQRLSSTNTNSMDSRSRSTKPSPLRMLSDPYPRAMAGSREMTLRLTLTRPDLRADETLLYPEGNDPLALDDLPLAPDGVDLWTNLGNDGGMFKKLWRRVSRGRTSQ